MKDVKEAFEDCIAVDYSSDDELLGFSNCTSFNAWLSASSGILWCNLFSPEVEYSHKYLALCLARQAASKQTCVTHIFSYVCGSYNDINFPAPYWKTHFIGPDEGAELLLSSLLIQALNKGFDFDIRQIDLSSPQDFTISFAREFAAAMKSQSGKVVIAVDKLDKLDPPDPVVAALSAITVYDQSRRSSVIIAAIPVEKAVSVLHGYPVVQYDSEYSGSCPCL